MRHLSSQLVFSAEDTLGECPVWDPDAAELLWTDIEGKRLHRLLYGEHQPTTLALERRLCAFAVTDSGQLLGAFDTGLAFLDRATGDLDWIVDVEIERPETRCNDGRPDRNGNFVFGTMVENARADDPPGHFYHWSHARGLNRLHRGARVPNGLCFGEDGLILHYADSATRTLWRARYHPQHALVIEDEVFVGPDGFAGAPDGATVDVDGNVWNARWGGSGVACFAPDATPIAFVGVDAPHVTACTFGGPNLDRLYITTARQDLSPDHPHRNTSGALYVADVGTQGIAAVPVAAGLQAVAPCL